MRAATVILGVLTLSSCAADGAGAARDSNIAVERLAQVRDELDALAVPGGQPAEVIGCGDSQDQPVAYRAWGPGESSTTAKAVADALAQQGWMRVEDPDVAGFVFEREAKGNSELARVTVLGNTAVGVSLPDFDAC